MLGKSAVAAVMNGVGPVSEPIIEGQARRAAAGFCAGVRLMPGWRACTASSRAQSAKQVCERRFTGSAGIALCFRYRCTRPLFKG